MRFVAVAIAVACAPALTSCSSSSSGAARPLPLGTATATVLAASQCGSTTSPVPISRCYRVTVACPDVAPLDAVVKVTDPAAPLEVASIYTFPSREAFDGYLRDHAPRLRSEGLARFGPQSGVTFRRQIGTILG